MLSDPYERGFLRDWFLAICWISCLCGANKSCQLTPCYADEMKLTEYLVVSQVGFGGELGC